MKQEYINIYNNLIKLTRNKNLYLNLKNNDKLHCISSIIDEYIACVSSKSKLLVFKTNELPTLKKGGGVQLQKIKKDDNLSDIQIFNLSNGLNWQLGKQTRNEKNLDFWIGKRAQSGKKVPKRFNKNLKFF